MRFRLPIAAGLLAVALHPLPGVAGLAPADPPDAARSIGVVLAAGPGVRDLPQWKGLARSVLERATADLRDAAGIAFQVDRLVPWSPPESPVAWDRELAAAREAIDGGDGIVVVLAAPRERPESDPDLLGYALLGRPYLILELEDPERAALTLRHELGHVFGLPHLPGRTVMAERPGERSWRFNAVSLDVLRAVRGMDFASDSPFVGCDLSVVRDAYLHWAESGTGHPSLLVNLGIALRREGRNAEAIPVLEAALRMDPLHAAARTHLSRARDVAR